MADPLKSIDTPHGRHYITATGNQVPSVTNIIGSCSDQTFLAAWGAKTAAEYARDHATALAATETDSVGLIVAGSAQIRNQAADLGTRVHEAIERCILGEIVDEEKAVKPYLKKFQLWRDEYQPETVATELTVFGPGYAGTLDYLCRIGGELTIVDFKTGHVKAAAALQLNALAHAMDEPVTRLAAVQIRPRSYTHIEVDLDLGTLDCFLSMLRVFRWQRSMDDWGKRR